MPSYEPLSPSDREFYEQKDREKKAGYAHGKWRRQAVQDKVIELKEMVDWHRNMIGPGNADRLKVRIDDLFKSAVRHGKRLARKK